MSQTPTPVGARFVGRRVVRFEDARLVTGRGEFVDDVHLPGTLHVTFVRSEMARGRITSIDTTEAAALPGVVAVFVQADLEPMSGDFRTDNDHRPRPFRLLAEGDVRYVGEPVALVVAESRYVAEDAAELVVVDISPEDALVDYEAALGADAPLVHPDRVSNVYADFPRNPIGGIDEVLAAAPVALTETFRQHRHLTAPMEARGILAHWDHLRRQLTVWSSTQGPHGLRSQLSRFLDLPDSQVRVIMPDVGGAFGLKMHPGREELATAVATMLLHRPVKWIQDRRENLYADEHCREDQATVTAATTTDGTILGFDVAFIESAGAYPAAGGVAGAFTTILFPGPYKVGAFAASARTVMTNTSGRGAYRGPWMFETVAREQMVDRLANHLGIDPLELRRRNVIRATDLPYTMASGMTYDQITVAETLDQAAEHIGYDEFRRQQAAWRADGRLVGIGISLLAEPTAMSFGWMSTDAANVSIGANGSVTVSHTGASHGQSLETTIAQVVADELGVDVGTVRVVQGDTDATPAGPGTGGSRSAVITGGAARTAAREVRAKVLDIVAHALEASPDDLEIADGRVSVTGTPTKGMALADVAAMAYAAPGSLPAGMSAGLEALARYTPDGFCTWSNACHMCTVEIDPDTGRVTILRYVVSEDCGVMINPNVVEGQIAGGVVQGIGGVLYEHLPYDERGNPLATTFMDYLLPTAAEVPDLEYCHIETFAPTNAGGHKGLGEGGAIGAPPAVINAVADALSHLGIVVRDQPLGPRQILDLLIAAGH